MMIRPSPPPGALGSLRGTAAEMTDMAEETAKTPPRRATRGTASGRTRRPSAKSPRSGSAAGSDVNFQVVEIIEFIRFGDSIIAVNGHPQVIQSIGP